MGAWTFGDYVEAASTQIVLYGSQDPVVVESLLHFAGILERLDLSEDDQVAVNVFTSRVRGLPRANGGG